MPRRKSLRKRPSTPNLKLHQNHHQHHTADPASPPETPTHSPLMSRKSSLKPRHQPPFFDINRPLEQDPSIKPVGNHQFSYRPALGPHQLSPRSSSSSSSSSSDEPTKDSADDSPSESLSIGSAQDVSDPDNGAASDARLPQSSDEDDEDEDGDEEEDGEVEDGSSEDESDAPGSGSLPQRSSIRITATTSTATVVCDFTIEDMGPEQNDYHGLDILYPTEIESNHSRSGSRHADQLDTGMMQDLKNLNCSNEASDEDIDIDPFEDAFLKRQQELKRIRRVSVSSSFGKRTHSELSDSDNDDIGVSDVNELGSSARRMRKRLHRGSLLFHDPPEPRIDELEEPDSSEDEFESLARELPYWTMEIMEMDSS
ncbi:hypothetical protein B0I35DRAFT_476704 [Stachybotrys elegans]|uniref:Uncharacterized protein n=1 Tax=Stachybotrys elegans TaxID=80388 RepID=A0A8K0SZ75_9HYPO|nr:hypothetical protein B0I35DRAFT_476704 [Stachybotrys elegans]